MNLNAVFEVVIMYFIQAAAQMKGASGIYGQHRPVRQPDHGTTVDLTKHSIM